MTSKPLPDRFSELISQLAQMCALAGEAMRDATDAVSQADIELADAVVAGYQEVAAVCSAVEETVFLLMASHQLEATDLRAVVNAIQIAEEARQMAEQAVNVATIAHDHHPDSAVPEEVGGRLADMGATAAALAGTARDALLSLDPRWETTAGGDGDTVEDLQHQLLTALIDNEWTHGAAAGVDVALLGCCYQRFADHAMRIVHRFGFLPAAGDVEQSAIAV